MTNSFLNNSVTIPATVNLKQNFAGTERVGAGISY